MGDSGNNDTSSTAEDFIDSTEVDQPTQDQNRSNIVGSSSYDAQFTADNLEARGLPPENFMSAANFAQTTQGGAGGDDTTSTPEDFIDSTGISVPSIQTASSNLAPGILGETLSDFQSGVRQDTPSNQMLEAAIGTTVPIPNVSRETLVDRNQIFPSMSTKAGIANIIEEQQGIKRGLDNIGDIINFGMGDPGNPTRNPINFGVTQQVLPTARPVDRIAAMTMPGTAMGSIPTEEIDDLADTEFAIPGGTGTTATGTNLPEDYEENVGRAFPVETLERAERLANEKTALENLGLPNFLSAVDPERVSRDLMATSLIAGRPISAVEGIRGVQAPNLQKETMEEYRERTGARIPESQIITDDSGLVVGIKDAQGNLVTGMDPNAREEQGDGGEQVRKATPKAPTDPCPEGYQLIDGKCTPVETEDKGTGFITFPPDRDPAFRRGPFTPTTVATDPTKINPLVPLTFGLSNIFKR